MNQLSPITDTADDNQQLYYTIAQSAEILLNQLLSVCLIGNSFTIKHNRLALTDNGRSIERIIRALDGIDKVRADITELRNKELAQGMQKTRQSHISIMSGDKISHYDYIKPRTINHIDYARLQKELPEIYQLLVDKGILTQTQSKQYIMTRIGYYTDNKEDNQ